ncbi:MAG: prolyl aminopeptidase [Pseudomonadota bacterium]
MQILYPEIKPYNQHKLKVSDRHSLYLEESGTPDGIPVVVIHGGPGAGCEPTYRRFFDPESYRIICYDQRGAGRSEPHACIEENSTWDLVNDLEAIREYLGIDKWMLFGGSWGVTLSLIYAQKYPERVTAMVMRGVFLGTQREIDWLYRDGTPKIYPDYYEQFLSVLKNNEREELIEAYYKKLTSNDEINRMAAAKAWSMWEGRTASLHTSHRIVDHFSDPHVALSMARIECHYFKNQCFLENNQIINNMSAIGEIPGVIVHGRYDMISTLESAWTLHHAWPASELHIVRDAGHAAIEPGIIDALVRATRDFARSMVETY